MTTTRASGREQAGPATTTPIRPPIDPKVRGLRIVVGVVAAAAALYAPFYFPAAQNKVLSQALYLAIAAMGLNLLTGFNGQVSIGHGAFFGVGAFTSGLLVVKQGWPYEATIPVAALVAAVVGLLVGFPALRVRGLYLALVTLGLAVLFPQLGQKYVKGSGGVPLLQPSLTDTKSLLQGLADDQYAYYLTLLVLVIVTLLTWSLVNSRAGRAMVAVRDQELAAATVGVNLAQVKVLTFAISAAYAGAAGSLSFMIDRVADATNPVIYFQRSIEFLVAMVVGGAATITGPIVGALAVVLLRRNTEQLIEGKPILSPALFGAALIAIVYVLPEGIIGGVRRLTSRVTHRPPPPSTLTTTTSDTSV